jgi:putative flippase GtrA
MLTHMANQATVNEVKRVGKFGIVGVINTVLDFLIMNILRFGLGLGYPIPSNVISTTCAMIFSFLVNKKLVFEQNNGSIVRQAATFFIVTAIGLYIIQNGVIIFLKDYWTWPLDLANTIVALLGLSGIFEPEFVRTNGAKAVGTVFSMTWNYLTYKRFVFKR